MLIRRLDPFANAADLAAALPAYQAWARESMPGLPDVGEGRLRYLASDAYQQKTTVLAAFADEHADKAEGLAIHGYELTKNLDLAWAELAVPAEARARGVESVLFEAGAKLSAQLERKRFALGLPESVDPVSFAARHGGGTYTDTAIMSKVDLSATDPAQLEAWAAPSEMNSGYTLVRWNEHCPDELAPSFCAAVDAMADQPLGDFAFEWAKNDLERLRCTEERATAAGVRKYVLAAVDPEGEVAGFTSIAAFPGEPELVEIFSTGVARQHRGHGLGLRIKAAASLWIAQDRPSTRWITTFNNDENGPMLRVNKLLGYRAVQRWLGYEFAVAL